MAKAKSNDSRRSTAAQFFLDEEVVDAKSTNDKVVELINQATLLSKDTQKVVNLKQVQELIVNKEPNLLDNFLDEMIAFQHDKNVEVRKCVVGFVEAACKKDPDILPKVVANLKMMLDDESPVVQKRVIQAAIHLYRVTLKWLCSAKSIDEIMESVWAYIVELKHHILSLLDCDNDGIRTHTIKFMEMLIIMQTYPDTESPKKSEGEMALDDVPPTLKLARPRKLEEEAKQMFDSLIAFHGTSHISSVNLMACMQTLTNIAKHRCEFVSKVIQALEALHANLPPTLAKSQVSSVRKHLKLQLLALVKHPASMDYHTRITTLLTDLGATSQEISKCIPKIDELRKRQRLAEESRDQSIKRIKLDLLPEMEDEKDEEEAAEKPEPSKPKPSNAATNTAIDITAEDIRTKLTAVNVTDLVLVSMLSLPDVMPAQFQSSYTPIAVAGTDAQIKHLSRLIATQLTAAGLGVGVSEMNKALVTATAEEDAASRHSIKTLVGGQLGLDKKKEKVPILLLPTGSHAKGGRGLKQINLTEITKPMPDDQAQKMIIATVKRIMNAERNANLGGVSQVRVKILSCLATQFRGAIADMLQDFIFEDLRNRSELAFSWLYEEYATYQCFNQMSVLFGKPSLEHYDVCHLGMLKRILQKSDHKERDALFSKFFLEVPYITESAIEMLNMYCQDENCVAQGLLIVKSLIENRPPKQLLFLCVLLDLGLNDRVEIRNQSVRIAKQLHERGDLRPLIETFALKTLKYLLEPSPPNDLFPDKSKPAPLEWTEEHTKICLHLYLTLLPVNHKLIHDLASVYVGTVADFKRTILRVLETPVKGMGMSSPELLLLVENCPKGAETLVTRIIHILTDKAPPSAELVSRVRDLYHKRVPDVRFLIPVLNGLTKKEVVAALPKLIKLNPIVVKEVFNRLLGTHVETGTTFTSPLTPAELLVALHNIDPSKCDMKTIIKATSMCFAEKNIYTQEVLAVVMQQLMEHSPLPTLLMRTVIQSLSLYPRLIGFVMNILQRLILKQVWKQKKVWEGFIKCCQRTKPQSFQVLLQLPPTQLKNVFDVSPELKEPLRQHVTSFTEHQRAHLPQAITDLLTTATAEEEVIPPVVQKEMLMDESKPLPKMHSSMETLTRIKVIDLQEDIPSSSADSEANIPGNLSINSPHSTDVLPTITEVITEDSNAL